MTYSLTPTPAREIRISGAIECSSPYVWETAHVTLFDNGQTIQDERLGGESGCGYHFASRSVQCTFAAEPGHLYTAVFDFYMDGVASNTVPYPNDPWNAGTCSSSPFRWAEFDDLSCSATLHYLAR